MECDDKRCVIQTVMDLSWRSSSTAPAAVAAAMPEQAAGGERTHKTVTLPATGRQFSGKAILLPHTRTNAAKQRV